MRRRQVIELAVGTGLLLGPLVYALTLEPAPAPECLAAAVEPAPEIVETVVIERCEQPPTPEVEPAAPEVEPAAPEAEPSELAEFLFVTDAGLVLSTEAERRWGTGRLFEPEGEISFRAAKRADARTVPDELWSLRGRSFDLYGEAGKVCTARLGELRVLAQYDGWSLGGVLGDDWYDVDPEGASRAEIRKGLWKRDDLWLVAEIESPDSCEGALWARDAELPPPAILRESSAPNPIAAARLLEFAESEQLAETKRIYEQNYAQLLAEDPEGSEYYDAWDEVPQTRAAEIRSWLDASAHPRLVSLEFGREGDGCGDMLDSRITSLDYVRGDEFVDSGYGYAPRTIFDLDHDGQYELLYEYGVGERRLVSATFAADLVVEQDWMCPC